MCLSLYSQFLYYLYRQYVLITTSINHKTTTWTEKCYCEPTHPYLREVSNTSDERLKHDLCHLPKSPHHPCRCHQTLITPPHNHSLPLSHQCLTLFLTIRLSVASLTAPKTPYSTTSRPIFLCHISGSTLTRTTTTCGTISFSSVTASVDWQATTRSPG